MNRTLPTNDGVKVKKEKKTILNKFTLFSPHKTKLSFKYPDLERAHHRFHQLVSFIDFRAMNRTYRFKMFHKITVITSQAFSLSETSQNNHILIIKDIIMIKLPVPV